MNSKDPNFFLNKIRIWKCFGMGVKQNSQIELSRANRVHLLKWSENLTASSIQIDSGWMALSSNQIEDDGDRANKRSSFKATLVYSNQSEGLVNNG